MISFSYPIILSLIPIIMMIWYIFFREKMGTLAPNALITKYLKTPHTIWILWSIRLMLVTLLITLLAGANITRLTTEKALISQDIMIVFDISLSMLAEDIHPNRMETAKMVIKNFIEARSSDRIGLIIFAGKPFVSIPFSTDYSGIKHMIAGLSPYLIRQDLPGLSGTNIGDAILLANMAHSGGKSSEKSIILLTDGRANIGIDPIIASEESRESHVKIYSVGIGSQSGTDLFYTDTYGKKTYFYNGSGDVLQADLDEPMMKNIAETTGGKYFHADNRSALETIFASIDQNLPKLYEEKTEIKSVNASIFLIIFVLIGIAVERAYLHYILRRYKLI